LPINQSINHSYNNQHKIKSQLNDATSQTTGSLSRNDNEQLMWTSRYLIL